jgi:hypothetical protein
MAVITGRFAVRRVLALTAFTVLVACSSTTSSTSPREEARAYARGSVPCVADSDCCVVVDRCINQALVVRAADKDKVASLVSGPDPGGCTSCILPAVQAFCDQGQCAGTLIDVFSPDGGNDGAYEALTQDHCGRVAGIPATSAAAPTIGTRAILGCGPR